MNGWGGYRNLHTLRSRFRAVAPLSLTIKGGIARLRLMLRHFGTEMTLDLCYLYISFMPLYILYICAEMVIILGAMVIILGSTWL